MSAFAADLGDVLRQLAMFATELAERRVLRHITLAGGVGAFFRRAHAFSMAAPQWNRCTERHPETPRESALIKCGDGCSQRADTRIGPSCGDPAHRTVQPDRTGVP